MDSILRTILPPIILGIIFLAFKIFCPPEPTKLNSPKSLKELEKSYQKIDNNLMLLFFIIPILIGIPLAFLFQHLVQYWHQNIPDQVYLIVQPFFVFWIGAWMTGIVIFGLLSIWGLKKILKDKWEEYSYYNDLKYQYNSQKVGQILGLFFMLFTTFLVTDVLDSYSCFGQQGIQLNKTLSFRTTYYQYEDIEKIKSIRVPKKEQYTEQQYFVLLFKDGYQWYSSGDGYNNDEKDKELIDFVLEKTNLRLEYEVK